MVRTISEKQLQAEAIAERLANRNRNDDVWMDAAPLHRIAEAFKESVDSEMQLVEAVKDARNLGYSWGSIADMMGVSKQTAQQKYGSITES